MKEFRSTTIDAEVKDGKPCIRGMRVTVGMIVGDTIWQSRIRRTANG